ncbi:MAG TPA: DNA replication and repair protein RecF [Ignavibacteria bacterium]|nr:DNA replication and repair protein RecF [Ignavibacteria bacterium]
MILRKFKLVNYRNYVELELQFNGKFNYIYGDNGHGKTNILEAISLLSFGKSFIGSGESDCVKFGAEEFFVNGEFENELENTDLVVLNYDIATRKKIYHLNREQVRSFSSGLFGRIPVVFLSPHSLNITYGQPGERRRFFDILISQTSSIYLDNLKRLVKLVKLKNALLKTGSRYAPADKEDLLSSYNEKLAETGMEVIYKRLNFLKEFKAYFEKNFKYLTAEDNYCSINYFSDVLGEVDYERIGELSREEIQKKLVNMLEMRRKDETDRGLALVGPQRDDYMFKLEKDHSDVFDLKNHASQGEHKTFVVALKLAEFDFLKEKRQTSPILLLDDILSELDAGRVSKIISHLKDFGQIFLTTTGDDYLQKIKEMYKEDEINVFKVVKGSV